MVEIKSIKPNPIYPQDYLQCNGVVVSGWLHLSDGTVVEATIYENGWLLDESGYRQRVSPQAMRALIRW